MVREGKCNRSTNVGECDRRLGISISHSSRNDSQPTRIAVDSLRKVAPHVFLSPPLLPRNRLPGFPTAGLPDFLTAGARIFERFYLRVFRGGEEFSWISYKAFGTNLDVNALGISPFPLTFPPRCEFASSRSLSASITVQRPR